MRYLSPVIALTVLLAFAIPSDAGKVKKGFKGIGGTWR